MTDTKPTPTEVQRAWEANAGFWDDYVGPEGNVFHRLLVAPAQMRLLGLKAGERVVELACGNGQFSREMARAGAEVTASDFSAVFVERARKHASDAGLSISCEVADVTDERQILALGEASSFDAAVCTMAVHDIADLAPMASALRTMLKPEGRFVFSVMHPAFNATNPVFVAETADEDGDVQTRYALKISRYRDRAPERGIGILGQPEPHWYFPRTFTELLAPFLAAGWGLDGLEEPAFSADLATPEKPFSWTNYPSIPPVLVVRLRPLPRA
jgi:SAM-dependent methyltransferase